ncbi:hypothetical protein [Rheinheimera sp.]|uniref:hypothetical protein n=1 Tax=Rheinheimera sp. TaxID=1869214 RepID=UPI004048BCFD
MNVTTKHLATLILFIGTLFSSATLATETGTRDAPNLIQCDTCYSVADFERKAKTQAQSNTAGYHLVYNMNTEVVETVYTFELYEPELGISMSNARLVSTLAVHTEQYREYLEWNKSGRPAAIVDRMLELPQERFDGMTVIHKSDVMNFLQNVKGAFYARTNWIVTVKFKNGDVIKVLALPFQNTLILIEAKDKNGKDISSRDGLAAIGGGSGGGAEGGGSSGSVTITISGVKTGGATLMCSPRNNGLEVFCKWV